MWASLTSWKVNMRCNGVLTGVLGRDLGVLADTVLAKGDAPLLSLGVKLPLPLALKLLTCLKTLHVLHLMSY